MEWRCRLHIRLAMRDRVQSTNLDKQLCSKKGRDSRYETGKLHLMAEHKLIAHFQCQFSKVIDRILPNETP